MLLQPLRDCRYFNDFVYSSYKLHYIPFDSSDTGVVDNAPIHLNLHHLNRKVGQIIQHTL